MPDLLHSVVDVLAADPLLTVFLVIGLGTAVGQIPLGPIRFGAAGALFVGLAVGALDPRLGADLTLLRSLGLALFCYTVGLAAGNTFFRDLRRQLPLMALCVVALVIAGAAGGLYSHLTGVSPAMDSGAYAGALTSPVLDAAIEAAGTQEPAVGYALAYPVGVAVAILIVAGVVGRTWPGRRDPRPASADGITATSVYLLQRVALGEMKAFKEGRIRISYLERDGETRVVAPGEELLPGDKVVIVGAPAAVESAMHDLGTGFHNCLAKDRTAVDFRRLTVSSTRVAGRTIAEVDMPGRFQGVITRVKRGDLDLLAREDLVLELGDRVLAVVPSDELEKAATGSATPSAPSPRSTPSPSGSAWRSGCSWGWWRSRCPAASPCGSGWRPGRSSSAWSWGGLGAPGPSCGGCRTPPTPPFASWGCCSSWPRSGWPRGRTSRPRPSR